MDAEHSSEDWIGKSGILTRRFMLYLPSKTKNGKDIPGSDRIADGIAEMLREKFGGATRYPAIGYFAEQKEEVIVIECYMTGDQWNSSSQYLNSFVAALGSHLQQESIACSLDGMMATVKPLQSTRTDISHFIASL